MRSIAYPLILALLSAIPSVAFAQQTTPVDYVRSVKPILAQHCYVCHGAWKQNGGLRLDTAAAMRKGGESGPAVVAADVEASLLIGVTTGSAGFRMPPENEGAPLRADEISILKHWIAQGAAAPADEQPEADPRTHWSYQPVDRSNPPVSSDSQYWSRNAIDTFIAARHQEHGLEPRPEASKEVLLRRLYLDLVGIPPTPDEQQEFLLDNRPDALHRITDKLLASPLYGQRWGRHWMDVWRYSDWYGSRAINEIRYGQRHLWRWRDWIVDSLNADVGYDRMIIEMLAGDELDPGNPDIVRATGFLGRNWYKFDRNVWMFETVEQSSQAFLALTMKCARCHDHKFDPITQRDYYHWRAFFEPHDVRTDPISSKLETEKDATLGPVLKEGLSFVYDKQLDAPTYLFQRGDSRSPKKDEPLVPKVPGAFGSVDLKIQPVQLPMTAVAPYLKPEVIASLTQQTEQAVKTAESQLAATKAIAERAQQRLAEFESGGVTITALKPIFQDTFDEPRPDIWKAVGGNWTYNSGVLIQDQPVTFPALLANVSLPRDFAARLRYKTLEVGNTHSVGMFFDVTDLQDAQAIYTATNNTKASVQAFHRIQGTEHYPADGIFSCQLKLQEEVTVDVAVRGQHLNIWMNGVLRLVYKMPTPRRDGSFALWTHAGGAEFSELTFVPLPSDYELAAQLSDAIRSPMEPPTLAEFRRREQYATRAIVAAEKQLTVARAEKHALDHRIAADRAKASQTADAMELSRAAAKAEKTAAVAKAEYDLFIQMQAVESLPRPSGNADSAQQKVIDEANAKVVAAQKLVTAARESLATADEKYTPVGTFYPATSSGRRLALARWIASDTNPRTARVAVNQLWLRHFGEAIVPTVSNFGLNGRPPSHPELLDWLALELVSNQWSMKPLHRQMVTSATYRLASAEGSPNSNNLTKDPTNRWFWRMNSRRLESEVIRDSVLYIAGDLDLQFGGSELLETTGMESRRRSMYFRSTPNERMAFLELFDQANPNECYRRQESVVPQQSLALFNSALSLNVARQLAKAISTRIAVDESSASVDRFIEMVFVRVLCRDPTESELTACRRFLSRHPQSIQESASEPYPAANPGITASSSNVRERAMANLIHVLLNHNDFVTVR